MRLDLNCTVTCADGAGGDFSDIIIDPISGLVLEHGHPWGKRELEIPGASIDCSLSDEVPLTPSKDEVGR
jgi:hypothetical protein